MIAKQKFLHVVEKEEAALCLSTSYALTQSTARVRILVANYNLLRRGHA